MSGISVNSGSKYGGITSGDVSYVYNSKGSYSGADVMYSQKPKEIITKQKKVKKDKKEEEENSDDKEAEEYKKKTPSIYFKK